MKSKTKQKKKYLKENLEKYLKKNLLFLKNTCQKNYHLKIKKNKKKCYCVHEKHIKKENMLDVHL